MTDKPTLGQTCFVAALLMGKRTTPALQEAAVREWHCLSAGEQADYEAGARAVLDAAGVGKLVEILSRSRYWQPLNKKLLSGTEMYALADALAKTKEAMND